MARSAVYKGLSIPPFNRGLRRAMNCLRGGYILCFHSKYRLFEQQVDALSPDRLVPLCEIVQRIKNGKPTGGLFALTADDGECDSTEAFAAVCIRRGWPMTFYLLTNYINTGTALYCKFLNMQLNLPLAKVKAAGDVIDISTKAKRANFEKCLVNRLESFSDSEFQPWLNSFIDAMVNQSLIERQVVERVPNPISWDHVEALAKHPNLSFQSHGVFHQPVAALSQEALERELLDSKREIEQHTNHPVTDFAYPYGSKRAVGNVDIMHIARHYESAVTFQRRRLKGANAYLLPRFSADGVRPGNLKVVTIVGR